jgi:hypothetical protein
MLATFGLSTFFIALGTCAAAIAAGFAVVYAALQIRQAKRARSVDRVLQLHAELTNGQVGKARDRFASYMWRVGAERTHQRKCWQPTLDDLRPPPTPDCEKDFDGARQFGIYPSGLGAGPEDFPLRDLNKILWWFDHIFESLHRNLVDETLLFSLVGSHAIWWRNLCLELNDDRHTYSVKLLAEWAESKDRRLEDPLPPRPSHEAEKDFLHLPKRQPTDSVHSR